MMSNQIRKVKLNLYRRLERLFGSIAWYFELRGDGIDDELHAQLREALKDVEAVRTLKGDDD